MAGDWIKMRGNLWDDPRVAKLCDLTGQSEAAIIGGLYWLWATADQHTEDGCMPGLTLRQIDRKTGIQGFGAGLCAIGWLHDDEQGVVLAHFEEHNGKSAKRRLLTAQRVAKHKSNAQVTHAALADDDCDVSGALPREEKRREEQIPSVAKATDGAGAPAPVKAKSPEDMAKGELWKAAVSVLEEGGCPKSQARTFMGKLVGDYTLAAVQQAVAAAVSAQPADAREYLKATCQRLKGERKDPVTVPSDAAEKSACYLADLAAHPVSPPPDLKALKTKLAIARAA